MKFRLLSGVAGLAAACLGMGSPALAQDAPGPITVSGEVALVSDYRFRGVSQTDEEMAIQGGINVEHESGFYAGTWTSNLSGWGTFGGSNMELDLYAGYATEIASGLNLDVGMTWFMYPGGASDTDFAELYAKASTTFGPADFLLGVAYAPKQQALGKVYNNAASYNAGIPDNPGAKSDNVYVWSDASVGVPSTPITLNAHLGYSNGNSGLGPNGTSIAPTGEFLDWSLGADLALGPVTLGVAYVDTDISRSDAAYLQPNFASSKDGSKIADSTILFSISAGF